MITKLVIENFKAIEQLEVPLRPFTILVGPNDSGKSTILQALELLGRAANSGSPIGLDDALRFHGDRTRVTKLVAHGTSNNSSYEYSVTFGGTGRGVTATDQPTLVADVASKSIHWDLHHLVTPSILGVHLANDGSGLASAIDEMLTGADREPLRRLEERLHQLSPFVRHVGTRIVPSSDDFQRKELTYLLTGSRTAIPASQMSGGVVLLTAFLWLRYGTNQQRYLIEEPENGVHPRATAMLAAYLRELAYEDQRQIIITTHSPFLLNAVSFEDVLIVTRHPTHGVRVKPIVDARFFAERIKELDLGELWFNIGEDELVAEAS